MLFAAQVIALFSMVPGMGVAIISTKCR